MMVHPVSVLRTKKANHNNNKPRHSFQALFPSTMTFPFAYAYLILVSLLVHFSPRPTVDAVSCDRQTEFSYLLTVGFGFVLLLTAGDRITYTLSPRKQLSIFDKHAPK